MQNEIAFPSLGQYYHVNEADNLINAFTEIGSNLKIPKKSTITLRKGKSEDDSVTINANKYALQKLDKNNYKDTMETIR